MWRGCVNSCGHYNDNALYWGNEFEYIQDTFIQNYFHPILQKSCMQKEDVFILKVADSTASYHLQTDL